MIGEVEPALAAPRKQRMVAYFEQSARISGVFCLGGGDMVALLQVIERPDGRVELDAQADIRNGCVSDELDPSVNIEVDGASLAVDIPRVDARWSPWADAVLAGSSNKLVLDRSVDIQQVKFSFRNRTLAGAQVKYLKVAPMVAQAAPN